MANEFCEEYSSSLKELTFNSKPHISMLTMLAEENEQFAPQIVKCIEAHLQKVKPDAKLHTLYLIDSIVKNVSQVYRGLFTQNLVSNFCSVFEKVDEKVRAQMYKLRQTWSGIFPNKKLYAIDVRVKELDPAWPILAQHPQEKKIHVNPKFIKTSVEDTTMKAVQELDGEVVKQKLLAKQQEMMRLQKEKLELELIQTQAVVEEQKRQIVMQEQKLRSQQHADLQQKIAIHQLTNVGVALATVANQGGLPLDPVKLMQMKVEGDSKFKDNSKEQNKPVAYPVTNAAAAAAAIAKSSGSNQSVAFKNQTQILSNSLQAPSQLYLSQIKSVIQQPIVGKSSLETVQKNPAVVDPVADGKSEGVGLKTISKMRSDKNEKDKIGSSKVKMPISKKRSASKSKDEEVSKSKVGSDGSKSSSSSSSKDFSASSSKGKARSKSSSLSPSKSRSGGKAKQWSPTSSRRTGNQSRSRSPNRREKTRDRDERGVKRDRRSPRRDKENDRLKGSSSKDAIKLDEEPPFKKAKTGDPELDQIFSGKDQDYRQLDHPSKLSPAHSNDCQGWAHYKASRPEQFKSRPRDSSDHREPPYAFGKQDLDLRTNSNLPVNSKLPTPWLPYRGPKLGQGKDGRPFERAGGPAVHPRMDPRLLSQSTSNCYQAIRENDPSIPRVLMFDKGPDILRQADSQLRAGQITNDEHREIMEQLAKLYELQRMRHMQKEQQMRESILSQRNEIGQHQEVIASSPEGSPRSDPETSKPTSNDVLLESAKEKSEAKQTPEVKSEPVTGSSEDELKKGSESATVEEEISILSESKREKEKPAIEVVISDDDDENEVKDRKRKQKRKSKFDPLPSRHHSRASLKPMPTNSVMIDDQPREIRFFGHVAVVVLENNDPREIAFRGPPQDVMIGKQVIRLGFGKEKQEFEFENEKHTIQFGTPTREFYIDDKPYCAVFGGPAISVPLAGKMCEIKLCGPTPEVFFGDKPRNDILPQIIALEEERRKFQAKQSAPMQNFKPGLIDRPSSPSTRWSAPNPPSSRDYDSREWRSTGRDEQFQRGSGREDWPPRGSGRYDESYRSERSGMFREDPRGPPLPPRGPDGWPRRDEPRGNYRGPIPPMRGDMMLEPNNRHGNAGMNDYYQDDRNGPRSRPPGGGYYMDSRYGPPLPPQMRRPMPGGIPSRFDEPGMPTRAMGPHGMAGPLHPMGPMPPAAMKYRPQYLNYPRPGPYDRHGGPHHPDYPYAPNQPMPVNYNPPQPAPAPQLNVSELFEKLVSTGIIPQMTSSQTTEPRKTEAAEQKTVDEKIPSIELTTESLKMKRAWVFGLLYSGIQCSSCGVRFTADQADKYAQHLDWHFRKNRREKDSARKPLSRKWFYDVQDWVQFEEIQDLDDRARSYFETQQADDQNNEVEDNGPSVIAGENEEDKKCAVCHEVFELYWDEEHEEWHFRDAIRKKDKNYHPTCYEDFKEPPLDDMNISIDEKMDEDVSAPLKQSEDIKQPTEPTETVGRQVNKELTEVDKPVDIAAAPAFAGLPFEPLVKEEPMETQENPPDGGFFGVFNVMSTSCSIPPLLAWENEEKLEITESKPEVEGDLTDAAVESADIDIPCKLELENVNEDDSSDDDEETSESEGPNDDEAADLNAVEEEVEPESVVSYVPQPEADKESESITNASYSLTESEPRISGDQNENIVNSEQLNKSGISHIIEEVASVSPKIVSQSVDDSHDNTNMKSIVQSEYISSGENIAKMVLESATAIRLISSTTNDSGVSAADDDVVLKESSDVVSDFSFETPAVGILEEDDLVSDMVSSDHSVVNKEDEELDDDDVVNTGDDRTENELKFIVQPIVSKGVETSGLCSIM